MRLWIGAYGAETKGRNSGLYSIPSQGSFALFMNTVTIRGVYTLAVELENHSILSVNVHPTPELFDAGEKWDKCSIAILQHRTPQ
jgi:hypothetical protein